MQKMLLLLIFASVLSALDAQNLVVNPSFETTSSCPLGPGQFPLATGWDDVNASADSCSSPDLIAACSWQIGGVNSPNMLLGYQQSRTGSHHAGLILYEAIYLIVACFADDYREYIGGQLSSPLQAGQDYEVSFYVSKANDAQWATDKFGMYFSNNVINYPFTCPGGSVMGVTPQLTYSGPAITDTLNWVKLQWTYTATGGEQYFAIGNFASTASTEASIVGNCGFAIHPYAYYFIDDVEVVPVSACGLSLAATVSDASCNINDGAIDLTVSNGTAPYQYNWSNNSSSEDLNSLGSGTYAVTVTDDAGCTATATYSLGVDGGPVITQALVTDVACFNTTSGAIDIEATGPSLPCSSSTVVINEVLVNAPGNTSSGDGSGCGNPTLGNPLSAEFIELIGPPGTDISCFVLTDGDWTITIPQGTTIPTDGIFTIGNNNTPLHTGNGTVFDLDANSCSCFTDSCQLLIFTNGAEYLAFFDNSGTFVDGLIWGTSPTSNNAPVAGTVLNTAALNGCVSSVTLPGPASFNQVVSGSALSYFRSPDGNTGNFSTTSNATPNACNVPSPPLLSYTWSNGDTTQDLSGIPSGIYTLTVTDENGCELVESYTLTAPSALQGTLDSLQDASCTNPGAIDVNITGGISPYSYLWSNAANTEDVNNLSAGSYSLTVTDNNGCTLFMGPYNIGSFGTPTVVLDTAIQPLCNAAANGAINVSVSGATAPYSYLWSNNDTNEDPTGLIAGLYTLTVTDATGCTSTFSQTLNEPAAITTTAAVVNATCVGNDGSLDLTVSGGTGPYSFQWDNGQATEDMNNLPNAAYELTVTDANNCVFVAPQPFIVALDSTFSITLQLNPACDNPLLSATDTLGASPYSYNWSNGSNNPELLVTNTGIYSLTVVDGSGCSASDSFELTAPIIPDVEAYISNSTQTADSIYVGQSTALGVEVDATNQGLSYSWSSNPITGLSLEDLNSPFAVVNANAEGSYNLLVTATSAYGCLDSSSVLLTVLDFDEPLLPTAFTPNNDQINEYFYMINMPIEYITTFKVFDRWGKLVYDNAEEASWDGTFNGVVQPADTYIYLITFQRPVDAEPVVNRGQISVLR